MTQQDIQRNKLLRLGIFELRNMARDLGVRSPTTLTKEVMIEEMLRIIRGEADPYTPLSKRGRPPKSNYKENVYSTEIIGVSMLRESRVSLDNIDSGSDVEVMGFVDNRGEEAYVRGGGGNFYNLKQICRISNEQLLRHGLGLGDFIRGMAKSSPMADMPIVIKVEEINGKAPTEHNPNTFDELEIKPLSKPLQLSKLVAKIGTRAIGFYQKVDDTFVQFMQEIDRKSEFVKIFIGIDCFPEEIVMCKAFENTECFYTTAEQNPSEHLRLIDFVISRAKSLACENKDVLLVVNGIDRVVRSQNLEAGRHIYDIGSFSISKKLLAVARQLEGGSVTVLALCLQKENNEFLTAIKEGLETMVSNTVTIN
ncbi:MAG: hypothetical protein LBN07_04160 [Christensenellaceae bacterium]|jgi:transcription termination factor Rho|nr:hypothetical protein [Christensenellaceae bacterium]